MAAYAIQFRRGNTTQHNSFTGLLGEVTVDTDKKTLVVHDGSTTGGFPLAREGAASNASTGSFTSNVTVGGTLAVTSTASFSDDVTITGDLGMTGHIIPSANITYDLGSPTMMWKDIYVGPGSLYVNGKKVIEDNNGSINFTTDTNETLKIIVPGTTGTLQFSAGSLQLDGEINAITGDITFGDHLDMNSNRIKNVSAPVEGADAANKTYVDGTISSSLSGGTLSFDGTTGSFSGDVEIDGSLTVAGTVTTVNSETIELADNILLLNSNALGSASQSGGIEIERGDDLNVQLLWDEANDRWSIGAEDFKAANFIGDLTGDVTGTVSSLSNHDTDDLVESSTNRFFTPAREAALSDSIAASAYNDSDVESFLSSGSPKIVTSIYPHQNGNMLGNSSMVWSRGYFNTITVNDAPTATTDATNKSYVDSEISTLSASVAASAYGDSDVENHLRTHSHTINHIYPLDSSVRIGSWEAPFHQVAGKQLVVTEEMVWPSSNAEHGSYKIIEIKGQTGTGILQTELTADVIKPGYSTGGDNVKLEPNTGGVVDVSNSKISNVSTPTDTTDAANKSYVDGEISTLSASVAAGAYDDGDVRDFLEAYDSNIVLSQSNNGIYLTSDVTESSVVIKNNSGGAFVYASKIQPFGSSTDLELEAKSGGKINVNGFRVYDVGTPTDSTDAANKAYVDSAANTSVANATGVNLDISNQDTDELSEGSANLYFTDARAVAAVKSALSMTHSGVYVVTAADNTGNDGSTHALTAATLGFDVAGKEFYQVFLNRQLLRPTEYTVNSSNGTITFSSDVLATDDEIEAVIYG